MRQRRRTRLAVLLAAVIGLIAVALPVAAEPDNGNSNAPTVRFATFNASLNRFNLGDLAVELSTPGSTQPDVIAEIIQRTRPDVLLINEFDFDAGNVALDGFHDNYLMVPHGTAAPIEYPHRMAVASNTGVPSGRAFAYRYDVLQIHVCLYIRPAHGAHIDCEIVGRIGDDFPQACFELRNLARIKISVKVRNTQKQSNARRNESIVHTYCTGECTDQPIRVDYADLDANTGEPQSFVAELFEDSLSGR